jgi:hypothetical protein
VRSDGIQPGAFLLAPGISGNGRHVIFSSVAADLPGGNGSLWQVYVHDRDADGDGLLDETHPGGRATSLVSFNPVTGEAGNAHSGQASIDENGRYVTFISSASNILPNSGSRDLYVHDRDDNNDGIFDQLPAAATSTVRLNVSSTGALDNGFFKVQAHAISADGRFVVFDTDGTTLDPSAAAGVFIRDRDFDRDGILDEAHAGANSTYLVSRTGAGLPAAGSLYPSISGDGKVVVFFCHSDGLLASPVDDNGLPDYYVRLLSGLAITKATFDYLTDTLVVNATSTLGSSDAVTLEGYGAMNWNASRSYWTKTITNVVIAPDHLTVTGKAGSANVQ